MLLVLRVKLCYDRFFGGGDVYEWDRVCVDLGGQRDGLKVPSVIPFWSPSTRTPFLYLGNSVLGAVW